MVVGKWTCSGVWPPPAATNGLYDVEPVGRGVSALSHGSADWIGSMPYLLITLPAGGPYPDIEHFSTVTIYKNIYATNLSKPSVEYLDLFFSILKFYLLLWNERWETKFIIKSILIYLSIKLKKLPNLCLLIHNIKVIKQKEIN